MKENLLLLGIAYPELSKKYKASVCMAGMTESGELRRVYPVPFRKFKTFGFHKKQWISYELREKGDYRKESYKIRPETLTKGDKITDAKLRKICEKNVKSIEELKLMWKEDRTSLGIVKPFIESLKIKEKQVNPKLKNMNMQRGIDGDSLELDILKYNIHYKFKCSSKECNGHKCMCLDTEAGQLYRNLVNRWGVNHPDIINKIEYRLFDFMKTRDLYFMMGTHSFHPTSWMIISLLYPPTKRQTALGDFKKQTKTLFDF